MDEIIDEQRIESLIQALEQILADLSAAVRVRDGAAQAAALSRMTGVRRELEAIRVSQDTAFAALLDIEPGVNEHEKVDRLLQAFIYGARLKHIRSDVMGEEETSAKVARQTYAIAVRLDAVGPGRRAALLPLLDHAHSNVRAMAAVCLMKSMPERACPVLDEISQSARGTSAGSTAYWSLSTHRFDAAL